MDVILKIQVREGSGADGFGNPLMSLFGVEGFNRVSYSGVDMTLDLVQRTAQDLRMPSRP